MTTPMVKISYADAPEMTAVLLCTMLFKLGGQLSITLGEINQIHTDFPEIRLALQRTDATGLELRPENEILTVTLRSRDHVENDRPTGGING